MSLITLILIADLLMTGSILKANPAELVRALVTYRSLA